jgi:hypothetical protein
LKPGPKPPNPSGDTRKQVEFGVSAGFPAAKLARLFNMPRQTFNRVFADEIENGRMRLTIKMCACLYDAAIGGNVASAKALLGFVERGGAKIKADPPPVVVDRWAVWPSDTMPPTLIWAFTKILQSVRKTNHGF